MYKFISFDTYAMNAMINRLQCDSDSTVSFKEIVDYAKAIEKVMESIDPDTVVVSLLDRRYQINFSEMHSDIVDYDLSGEGIWRLKKINSDIFQKLMDEYRWSMSADMYKAFMSPEALNAICVDRKESEKTVNNTPPRIKEFNLSMIYLPTSNLVKILPMFNESSTAAFLNSVMDNCDGEVTMTIRDQKLTFELKRVKETADSVEMLIRIGPYGNRQQASPTRCRSFRLSKNDDTSDTLSWLENLGWGYYGYDTTLGFVSHDYLDRDIYDILDYLIRGMLTD